MINEFKFTWQYIENQFKAVVDKGYRVITCQEYSGESEKSKLNKVLINRVDIDFSIKKAARLASIFDECGIKGTFFVRLHANEYNPLSFENLNILRGIMSSGHELGYHSEIIDESVIFGKPAGDCLRDDLDVMETILGQRVTGVASHGGMTGLNNLDFWSDHAPQDYDLQYEAYDWLDDTFYVSDSEWINWKCYNKGKLVVGDKRSLAEHLDDSHKTIYSLTHPDTYYDRHIYE